MSRAGVRQGALVKVPVPGPALPVPAGRGLWRVRCLMCGGVSPTARASLLAAFDWQSWHAPLTGCLEHGLAPRQLPRPVVHRGKARHAA